MECLINTGRVRKKIVLFFFFMILLMGEMKAVNDTLRVNMPDTEDTTRQIIPLSFSYKNVRDYIFSHLSYPVQAIEEEIEGTVEIRFTLMKDGHIDSVEVLTPVHPLLDTEAVRLIRNMPLWRPVYLNGQPVSLSYEVPVIFELLPAEVKQDSLK